MAAHLGVPRRRTGVAGLVTIGLSVLTGVLVGVPAVPLLLRASGAASAGCSWPCPCSACCSGRRCSTGSSRSGLRVLRREPLEHPLSAAPSSRPSLLYVVAWLSFGVHILVLARAVGGGAGGALTLASLTGYALAGALAMLTVILPAGLGAREGLLTLVLASALPVSGARGGHPVAVRRHRGRRRRGRRRLGVRASAPPRGLPRRAEAEPSEGGRPAPGRRPLTGSGAARLGRSVRGYCVTKAAWPRRRGSRRQPVTGLGCTAPLGSVWPTSGERVLLAVREGAVGLVQRRDDELGLRGRELVGRPRRSP